MTGQSGHVLKYEAARRALSEAVAFDEIKGWADKAEALRAYARQAGDVQLEQDASEIRLRAVRRFGQLELELKSAGLMHQGGRPSKTGQDAEPVSGGITLADLGATKAFSANAQKVGGIAERAFEEMVARKRDQIAGRKGRVSLDIVKELEDERRRADHESRTHDGGKIDDLHALAASGFKAGAILADPAWQFIARSDKGEGRSASQHYDVQGLDAIKALPIKALAADDCVLFMWMVDWCPHWAFEVIEAWGFEHKTTAFTWVKLTANHDGQPRYDGLISDRDFHFGQGYWTRANPEDCWLATRGSPKRINADVRQLIIHPVMEHSRKPDDIHGRIERLVDGPYLELNARREVENWLTWGNEIEFKPPPSTFADDGSPTDQVTGEIIGEAAE
jgi:N6-adenosine-specific RNA methylase IME4